MNSTFELDKSKTFVSGDYPGFTCWGGMYAYKTWQNKKAAEAARIAEMQAAANGTPIRFIEHPCKNQPSATGHFQMRFRPTRRLAT